MDTWNRLTSAQREGDRSYWIMKVKGLAKEHICMPMDMYNTLVKAKVGEKMVGGGGQRRRRDYCNNIKIIF